MKKLSLIGLVAAALTTILVVPDAVAQIRRGGRVPLGSPDTNVRLNGALETNASIFPVDTTLGMTVDGGATVLGTLRLGSAVTCGAAAACGSVALTSASPSTATVTVPAGVSCACWPVGTSAAIAAGGCAASVTSTTLTLTGPNTVTTTMRYMCFL